ncbi:MAG: histidinol dehydrogenase [Pseudomonadales bacterium]
MKQLSTTDSNFEEEITRLLDVPEEGSKEVKEVVANIIEQIRAQGDKAVLELTKKFDRIDANSVEELEISKEEMRQACSRVSELVLEALKSSIARIKRYHEEQKKALGGDKDWQYEDSSGNRLGQQIKAMERVGIYVPGGKASYPSSVIMTAVPARVAGVSELTLVVPAPDNVISDVLLAAAYLCDVDRLIKIGGAQAVAALAYGTETIGRVDKIVGPGNIYVATAKEMVFGHVGIDMIAGPSEVVIVADKTAQPDWLVMDLFAQAEHDEMAQAILISPDRSLLDEVAIRVDKRLEEMARSDIIEQSISRRGALILVRDLTEAVSLVNRMAPEHLELAVDKPEELLADIRHAGAIFMGHHTAEVAGDYSAGPSHVLPTNGSARFSSPLGVYDFQVRTSLVWCSPQGSIDLSRAAAILAREEGLEAHALSAEYRVENTGSQSPGGRRNN